MYVTSKRCGKCGREVPLTIGVGDTCPYCKVKFDFERGTSPRGASSGRSLRWAAWVAGLVLVAGLAGTGLLITQRGQRREQGNYRETCSLTIAHYREHTSALVSIVDRNGGDPDGVVGEVESYCKAHGGELSETGGNLEKALSLLSYDIDSEAWPMRTMRAKLEVLERKARTARLSPETRAMLDTLAVKRSAP